MSQAVRRLPAPRLARQSPSPSIEVFVEESDASVKPRARTKPVSEAVVRKPRARTAPATDAEKPARKPRVKKDSEEAVVETKPKRTSRTRTAPTKKAPAETEKTDRDIDNTVDDVELPGGRTIQGENGKLILRPYQVPHFDRIMEILEAYSSALDPSVMGLGKTIITLAVAIVLKLPILVFAPPLALEMWRRVTKERGVKLIDAISYNILVGIKGRALNHPYLTRTDGLTMFTTKFEVTQHFTDMLQKPFLIVFDEMHKTQNATFTSKAAHALMDAFYSAREMHSDKELKRRGKFVLSRAENFTGPFIANPKISAVPPPAPGFKARALFLSATAGEKISSWISHLRLLGIIREPSLDIYDKERRRNELTGAHEVYSQASEVNASEALRIFRVYFRINAYSRLARTNAENIEKFIYHLYTEILQKLHLSEMKATQKRKLLAYNARINIKNKQDYDVYRATIEKVFKMTTPAGNVDIGNVKGDKLAALVDRVTLPAGWVAERVKIYTAFEMSKVRAMCAEAIRRKTVDPKVRLVLVFSFTVSIDLAAEIMRKEYGDRVEVINGKVTKKQRSDIEKRFQQRDGPIEVLIAQIATISEAIDLDDTHAGSGNTRLVYVAANGSFNMLHQLSGRFARANTVSVAEFYVCYGRLKNESKDEFAGFEQRLRERIESKTSVIEQTNVAQVEAGIEFPGNYPIISIG